MSESARTLWGGVVPVRAGVSGEDAARAWAQRRGVRRLQVIWPTDMADAPTARILVAALEAAGIAVFPFEHGLSQHAGGSSAAAIAEAVAAFHFDRCEAIVGVGAAVDLAKAASLMVAQRRPLMDLAAEPDRIDPRATAPCLILAPDLATVAACGGSVVLIEDRGCPVLLRDGLLRPDAVVYCPGTRDDSAAVVAALAHDAGGPMPEIADLAVALLGQEEDARRRSAVDAAGLLERQVGPARVLAAYCAVIGDVPPARTLAALGPREVKPASVWPAIADRLGYDPTAALDALMAVPLEGLALIDPRALPVDLTPALAVLGRDVPSRGRRGGRRRTEGGAGGTRETG